LWRRQRCLQGKQICASILMTGIATPLVNIQKLLVVHDDEKLLLDDGSN
jgi:hypothetical protein